jgi:alpha-mannosidase
LRHTVRHTLEKLSKRLKLITPLVYRRSQPLEPFAYKTLPGPLEPPLLDTPTDDWERLEFGTHWGAPRTEFMLRSSFSVPTDWDAALPVVLYLPLGEAGDFSHPEALVYLDGTPYAAADRHHQEVQLPDGTEGTHELALHGWTGINYQDDRRLYLRECSVVQLEPSTRAFVNLARVALETAQHLEDDAPARGLLLNALDDAFKGLETRDLESGSSDAFYASVPGALETLKEGVHKAGPAADVSVAAAGHAHIDVAWLWTLGQTRRKAGRTFHTVLRLMEEFPEYSFSQSQPQLYDYVQQDYPELFEAIKERVADGRWETLGGMWVEADCNLSGSESLARQFVLGRAFFKEHFAQTETPVDSPVLWLPDVFGYAWNLPQLIKEADLEYFFTIKIGWSQYNRLPFDSFYWQGLDGTKVLTHFSTTPEVGSPHASTYNASATPEQNLGTWRNFQQKDAQQDLFMAFGYGDGGGGPTREMLENISLMKDFPGVPKMRHSTAKDFFEGLEKTSGDKLPTWNGELYLELHRGTYTTQSRNKRANRKSEFLLHDAEFVASLASTLDASYSYPAAPLRKAWELVCLNQFHDIIPGSSIGEVYTESLEQYEEVRQLGETARDGALTLIAQKLGGEVVVVNPTSFARDDLAFLPETVSGTLCRADGLPVLTQEVEGGTLLAVGQLEPYSATPLRNGDAADTPVPELSASETHLENAFVRVELNSEGDITRVFDETANREVLAEGAKANEFLAFEDRPNAWDAWDVDIFYDDKVYLADAASSVSVVERGPLRVTLEVERRILNSAYTQRLSLTYNSPRLDITTDIDWRERHTLLKVAFPVNILSPVATFEIQWGQVQRPTHRNTSWDWARFETCAQKWVDLSESDYGVSLLNDCKYGHDVQAGTMRLSLLRSPTAPDPEADQGRHTFTYSLLPHAGAVGETTVAAAYTLNDPLLAVRGKGDAQSALSLFSVDRPNVVIETVKRAENGSGIVVRLYESQRQRGSVTLQTGFDLGRAERTNLLETPRETLTCQGNRVAFDIKPFEIVTLKLTPA